MVDIRLLWEEPMNVRHRTTSTSTRARRGLRVGAFTLATMAALTLGGPLDASAAPVAPGGFTCGVTVFTACNQSAHATDISQVGTPITGVSATCPSWLSTDYVGIVGTGNGVEHAIINNAGDAWFTSTQTGTVALTAYPLSSMDLTDLNNPVIKGLADPLVPSYTGHLTEWFGGAFNKNNMVFGGTVNFSGADTNGTTFTLHLVTHANTIPNSVGPHMFQITTC
jgi:hypothetical protein